MSKVRVFRFQYADRNTGQLEESPDYATEKAITEIGATKLEDTVREVDERWVSWAGIVMRQT
ncbi:MAG TPA: hypothetical protein VFD95_02675 [Usitatibacter sp.]|jgi:hypothetical protein|nr:hypothetical protein [Usitatibacter sp.]